MFQFLHLIGFYLYHFTFKVFFCHDLYYLFWKSCNLFKCHFQETREGFHPIDNSKDLVESSVGYYPVAHSGHFDVHFWVVRKCTCHWPREHTNQLVTGNQVSTVILKWITRAVKYTTNFSLGYVTRNWRLEHIEGHNCSKNNHKKTKIHLCQLMCGNLLRDLNVLQCGFN